MRYSTKIKSPQKVGDFLIDPKGGNIDPLQLKAFKRDPYGKDLIDKGFFIVDEAEPAKPETGRRRPASAPAPESSGSTGDVNINRG
ncbi:hypothetical protein AGMMS49944_29650 [Spirochaetia bacterium]|nr:hypothetical protein AGMMS49944_29650 [Spirochaetia bacterium]